MGAKERVLVITTLYFIYFILSISSAPALFSFKTEYAVGSMLDEDCGIEEPSTKQ